MGQPAKYYNDRGSTWILLLLVTMIPCIDCFTTTTSPLSSPPSSAAMPSSSSCQKQYWRKTPRSFWSPSRLCSSMDNDQSSDMAMGDSNDRNDSNDANGDMAKISEGSMNDDSAASASASTAAMKEEEAAPKTITPISPTSSSSSTNDKIENFGSDDGYDGLGEYDPSEAIRPEREVNVGNPQIRVKERSVNSILKELAAIQESGPQKYCILGTRHCSYLHQQIIELLAYALVLSGNHVYTSGAGGTHAATIKGALRAEREDLLTVVIPQSLEKQTKESQDLLKNVKDLITMPQNDDKTLDVASRICNSYLLGKTDQLISFAFHESNTVIEATKEAKEQDMLVTTLFLD